MLNTMNLANSFTFYCGIPSRSPDPNTVRLDKTNVTPKFNKIT